MYQIHQTSFSKNKFNLEVTEINQKIPSRHWTPKLLKNLVRAKFNCRLINPIIAARKMFSESCYSCINVNTQADFELSLQNPILFWCQNILWPVQNYQNDIDTINQLNSRNKTISISTYDFSSLYTNISHH